MDNTPKGQTVFQSGNNADSTNGREILNQGIDSTVSQVEQTGVFNASAESVQNYGANTMDAYRAYGQAPITEQGQNIQNQVVYSPEQNIPMEMPPMATVGQEMPNAQQVQQSAQYGQNPARGAQASPVSQKTGLEELSKGIDIKDGTMSKASVITVDNAFVELPKVGPHAFYDAVRGGAENTYSPYNGANGVS